jgi:hypothetical protein
MGNPPFELRDKNFLIVQGSSAQRGRSMVSDILAEALQVIRTLSRCKFGHSICQNALIAAFTGITVIRHG